MIDLEALDSMLDKALAAETPDSLRNWLKTKEMMKPVSYTNGNTHTLLFGDGTRVRWTKDDEFLPAFADNIDIKITDACDAGCEFCHEGSTKQGRHGDVLNQEFWDTLHQHQEVALGGGNILSHPDIDALLLKLKNLGVIANITVNQIHFEKEFQRIKKWSEEGLVKGIGVSFNGANGQIIEMLQQIPNTVVHTIAGIHTVEMYRFLADKGLKVLVLGYKDIRRGKTFRSQHGGCVEERMLELLENLEDLVGRFEVFSFDCLALEQLDIKNFTVQHYGSPTWETLYSGEDGSHTFYIDAVSGKFAVSSTSPLGERFDVMSSVDDMFKKVQEVK